VIVTESKLTELMGYTKSEIKGRRQSHWIEGVHFAYDPARKVVYNIGEIERWAFPVSETNAASAKFVGMNMSDYELKSYPTRLPHQVSKKPQRYV
jgi:hypothetical protein